jgi:putative transposase
MRHRRANAPSGSFFFTVNLADRTGRLLTDNVEALRSVFRRVRERHPFQIDAIVVLPDHLHTIWSLPAGDSDFAKRWALIKAGFSRSLPKVDTVRPSRERKRERGVWQRRYWEHQIRDEDDFERHVEFIHFNPVKHGLVGRAADWPYSSIHRHIRQGVFNESWAASMDHLGQYGEGI